MIDSKTALDRAMEATPPEIRVVVALLVERLGGAVSFDHEDAAPMYGRAFGWECERGTITLRVVGAPS